MKYYHESNTYSTRTHTKGHYNYNSHSITIQLRLIGGKFGIHCHLSVCVNNSVIVTSVENNVHQCKTHFVLQVSKNRKTRLVSSVCSSTFCWPLTSHIVVGTSADLRVVVSSLCVVVVSRLAVVHVVVGRRCLRCSREGGDFVLNDRVVIPRAEVSKTVVVVWYCCVTIFCRRIAYRQVKKVIFK